MIYGYVTATLGLGDIWPRVGNGLALHYLGQQLSSLTKGDLQSHGALAKKHDMSTCFILSSKRASVSLAEKLILLRACSVQSQLCVQEEDKLLD